jgi:hypothetical protein
MTTSVAPRRSLGDCVTTEQHVHLAAVVHAVAYAVRVPRPMIASATVVVHVAGCDLEPEHVLARPPLIRSKPPSPARSRSPRFGNADDINGAGILALLAVDQRRSHDDLGPPVAVQVAAARWFGMLSPDAAPYAEKRARLPEVCGGEVR